MQTTHIPVRTGTTVFSSDGDKIGDIAEVHNDYFVIEKGFIFTEDLYIPMSSVTGDHGEDGIRVSMSKSEIENGDWSQPPLSDQDRTGDVGYAGQHTDARTTGADDMAGAAAAGTAGTAGATMGADRDTLERREERLRVDKERERQGSVHVGKRVVEDEQSVDVPVTREEVSMERRSVDRPATGTTSSDDAIDVPVYGERVEAEKDARVVEELEVEKTPTTHTERVSGTVRREEFDIDDETTRP